MIPTKLPRHSLLGLILAAILCVPFLQAEEQTVRIIGLSDASRAVDFREVIKTLPELELVSLDESKATATLRFDIPTLLAKPKPKPNEIASDKIIERIDNLIGKASTRTFSVTAPTGIAEDKLTKVEIKVGVLDCKGCRYGAYIAIAKIDGVERVTVNSDSRTLAMWIDPAKTNKDDLLAALKKGRVEVLDK